MSLPEQFSKDQWGFQDITLHPIPHSSKAKAVFNYPTELYREAYVNELIASSNPNNAWGYLETLSAFNNRYYTSSTGVQSSQWINSKLQEWIDTYNRSSYVKTELYDHRGWPQQSIIATISPFDANVEETVVLGAHCDSIASNMPNGRAPGADDDGSGTVTLMEAFRVLLEAGYRGDRILEFQFYAAEELGLLGSADIAAEYAETGRQVYAMLQYDMNSYNPQGTSAYRIMYDRAFMDEALTDYLYVLARGYTNLAITSGSYGYAASDHASYAREGFPACHAKESTSYPTIHTFDDVMGYLDIDYMFEFLGPALGFAVELTNGQLPKRYE